MTLDRYGHPTSGNGAGIIPGLLLLTSPALVGYAIGSAIIGEWAWAALILFLSVAAPVAALLVWTALENRRLRHKAREELLEEILYKSLGPER